MSAPSGSLLDEAKTGQTLPKQDVWDSAGCPAGGFARRSFLQGAVVTGIARAWSGKLLGGKSAGEMASAAAIPFYGEHQAGIATPAPNRRQAVGNFVAFDVTAANRRELTDLFRTLTAQAAFLAAGGPVPTAPPRSPQPDEGILGPRIPADALTITVAVGASLFDGRYGLASRKPVQLVTMKPFRHDNLNPALSQGDLLIQLCAATRDTAIHALLEIIARTSGAMTPRWSINGLHSPPRPVGVSRDFFGFKDGITNPDVTNTAQMNQVVWVQPHTAEHAWEAGD